MVNGHGEKIRAKDPAQIPGGQHDVDVVIESTGFFTDKDGQRFHHGAGAKGGYFCPGYGDLKTIVF